MSEPEQVGWQVLDPDGNTVEAGIVTVITAAASTDDPTEE